MTDRDLNGALRGAVFCVLMRDAELGALVTLPERCQAPFPSDENESQARAAARVLSPTRSANGDCNTFTNVALNGRAVSNDFGIHQPTGTSHFSGPNIV